MRQRLRVVLLHRLGRVEKTHIGAGPDASNCRSLFQVRRDYLETLQSQRLQVGGNHVRSCSRRLDSTPSAPAAQRFNANRAVPAYKSIQVYLANAAGSPEQSMLNSVCAGIRCRTDSVPGSDRTSGVDLSSSNHSHRSQPSFLATIFPERPRECFLPQPSDPLSISAGWSAV